MHAAHLAAARRVADAVLYEGYLLYPYRASSPKNQVRWQFGVLMPQGCDGEGPEPWANQTDCLIEADRTATVEATIRFLHVVHRTVEAAIPGHAGPAPGFERVESLTVDGDEITEWDEAVAEERVVAVALGEALDGECVRRLEFEGGTEQQEVHDATGAVTGRVTRVRYPLLAKIRFAAEEVTGEGGRRVVRLRIRCENAGTGTAQEPRPDALRRALVSAHALIRVDEGHFLSVTDPPPWAEVAARGCRNQRVWPVLIGSDAASGVVLSSPIILPDDPAIAPESPGDLFDATEIDEILTLRVMTLSDDEKREVRATDQRGRDILDRAETMPPEALGKLHGAVRSLRPLDGPTERGPQMPAGWDEIGVVGEEPAPEDGCVVVSGVEIRRGSRVVLHPLRRSDPMDTFLAGRDATVHAVAHDVDGSVHVAVTVDDDPAAELQTWYRRYFYFSPDEVVPVVDTEGAPR